MHEDALDRGQRFRDAARAARQADDERLAPHDSERARQRGERRMPTTLRAHGLAEARDDVVAQGADGLRRAVPRPEARAPGASPRGGCLDRSRRR